MSTRAFDENGNEVFPVIVNTIAPIEYSEQTKQIAYDFLNSQGSKVTLDMVMPINLKPINGNNATHIFCSRTIYNHELRKQLEFMEAQNLPWIVGALCFTDDPPEHIKRYFCTVVGNKNELLTYLNLEEVG